MVVTGAIIGGTGVYAVPGLDLERCSVETEYGGVDLFVGRGASEGLIFLPRHGPEHSAPPHRINYRANIKALQMLGARRVLALSTVGSLRRGFPPACMVLLSDFIDFTRLRVGTYYDGVTKYDGTTYTTYTTTQGLASTSVYAIAEDSNGHMWFGTSAGVSAFDGTSWTTYTPADGLANSYVYAMAIDAADHKWFGTRGGVSALLGLDHALHLPLVLKGL